MSAMESIVDTYLTNHGLADNEDAKEQLIVVINDCFKAYVDHMHHEFLTTPAPSVSAKTTTKSASSSKPVTTVSAPDECTTKDQLTKCTITTLTTFCKERQLKVGGKKDEVVHRVWRHLQGESSDEDHNPKSRKTATTAPPTDAPTKTKRPTTNGGVRRAVTIHHGCEGVTKTGKPCVLEGTLCNPTVGGGEQWFCWRHTPTTDATIQQPPANPQSSESGESDQSDAPSGGDSDTPAPPQSEKPQKPKHTRKPKKVVAVPPTAPLEEEE